MIDFNQPHDMIQDTLYQNITLHGAFRSNNAIFRPLHLEAQGLRLLNRKR